MTDNITIVGNIASDPRPATTGTGIDVITFRVASDQRRYDKASDKWIDGEPNWYTVSAYRALAVHAATSLHKGDRVIVHGKLRLRPWTDGEKRGTAVEIDAEAMGPDLRWGTTTYTRAQFSEVAAVEPVSNEEEFPQEFASEELEPVATPF